MFKGLLPSCLLSFLEPVTLKVEEDKQAILCGVFNWMFYPIVHILVAFLFSPPHLMREYLY